MPIAQSKRKLIAAAALLIAVGTLTATIGMVGVATVSLAQTTPSETGGNTTTPTTRGQQGAHFQQGTITSSPSPLPGHEDEESALILPPLASGSVYSGVITYTSSEPVQVAVLQVQDLNATERQIVNATDSPFGTLPTSQLDNRTSVVVTLIGAPADSGSIPFAGNAVGLHSTDGTPFVATYTLDAQEHRPEMVNHISNATTATTEEGGGGGGGE